jgi:hypothetical protein
MSSVDLDSFGQLSLFLIVPSPTPSKLDSCLRVARASRVWSASIATGPYRGGRSKHWIKVKNRTRPAMVPVMEGFA